MTTEHVDGITSYHRNPSAYCLLKPSILTLLLQDTCHAHNPLLQSHIGNHRRAFGRYHTGTLRSYRTCPFAGFTGETSKACCGGGGPYNFNSSVQCGNAGATVCENPSRFINWDGMHSTEAAYRLMTKGLLQGNYTFPRLASLCVSQM
ncbi:hypothetical protein L3X38_021431 [Prunus dulcis]|uniref:GDSL-like Lipase/Acylhydrolase superfamily protein n=1 Tax=Prunus dulcis TaxID=3755 RepID=A0AAD4VU20_PRUDU|nr:hypothetical protein L3X38_021431 [Prunus dulcis]